MAEEHGFRASEDHRLCLNNCGFFGAPATRYFCSKCYHDLFLNNNNDLKSPKAPVDLQPSIPSSSVVASPAPSARSTSFDSSPQPVVLPLAQPNRCSTCRKKVGLTGFRCRCGITFCGTHRYPEQHGCSFDFKTIGREAIAKANPVIKGIKLEKL